MIMIIMMRGANEGTLNDPRDRFRSHNNSGQIKKGRKEGIVLFATYEFLACHRRLLLLLWIGELMGVVVVVLRMRK
jgi:hypothetical protein